MWRFQVGSAWVLSALCSRFQRQGDAGRGCLGWCDDGQARGVSSELILTGSGGAENRPWLMRGYDRERRRQLTTLSRALKRQTWPSSTYNGCFRR